MSGFVGFMTSHDKIVYLGISDPYSYDNIKLVTSSTVFPFFILKGYFPIPHLST